MLCLVRFLVLTLTGLVVACQSTVVQQTPVISPLVNDYVPTELLEHSSTIHVSHKLLKEAPQWGVQPEWQDAAGLQPDQPFYHQLYELSYQPAEYHSFGYYLRATNAIEDNGKLYDALIFANSHNMRRNVQQDFPYINIELALQADYPGALIAAGLLHFTQELSSTLESEQILTQLRQRAEAGDAELIGFLAYLYAFGTSRIEKNSEEGRKWAEKGAQLHDPISLLISGWQSIEGIETQVDRERGLDLYTQAAELGLSRSAYALGMELLFPVEGKKEIPGGLFWLEVAATDGDAVAQYQLGLIYRSDEWGKKDQERSNYWMFQSAQGGHPLAQWELAHVYLNGTGLEPDRDIYVYWLYQSALNGYAEAQNDLAQHLIDWDGETHDWENALPWLAKAADQGHLGAMANLGHAFYNGLGTEIDYEIAMEVYKRAAALGRPGSMFTVGLFYVRGQGVEIDYDIAREWFIKAIEAGNYPDAHAEMGYILWDTDRKAAVEYYIAAANLDVSNSQDKLIRWYSEGDYLDVNINETLKWLKVGAERGNTAAMKQLSKIYHAGILLERDPEQFVKYTHMGAEAGDAELQVLYAQLYTSGRDVEPDIVEAFKWLQKAVDQQYYPAYTPYAGLLGSSNIPGDPQEKFTRAKALLEEASEAGDPMARILLSSYNVSSRAQDALVDIDALERGARAGNMIAITALAEAYYRGRHVEQDLPRAYTLALQGAELGSGSSQYLLGTMLDAGDGTEKDLIEAYKWMSLAAQIGHSGAKLYLQDLADLLSEAQIGIAEKRALDWFAAMQQTIQER